MAINYREVGQRLPPTESERYSSGINLMNALAASLQKEGLLPKRFVTVQPLRFDDEARKALVNDGATIYALTGETIQAQQEDERPFSHVSGVQELLALPSRIMQVAIYADPKDPERFFVPDSSNRARNEQEALIVQESRVLRERLGITGVTMILPEAPEATEVIFKHLDETGVYLLGENYRISGYKFWPYIRTNTPTNSAGSNVAVIGDFSPDVGLRVDDRSAEDRGHAIRAARWVVPLVEK